MGGELGGNARPVSARIRDCDGVTVTVISGAVDHTAELMLDEVREQLRLGPPALILDLRAVTFLGSIGLSALVDGYQKAAESGTRLLIVADQRAVLRPLAVTDLDRLVDLYPDLDTALAAVR